MQKNIDLILSPYEAANERLFLSAAARKAGIRTEDVKVWRILSRSVDARQKNIKVNLRVFLSDETMPDINYWQNFRLGNVENAPEVIVVGAGPAGLFAALKLIELGLKPIILERGRNVSERKRDLALIHRNQALDPDSNYGFGEGGAGAFSDGKLYTRSNKRGNVKEILELLYLHGAAPEILYDAHPHIGTDCLPTVISKIRQTIENCGGKYFFSSRVDGLLILDGSCVGVKTSNGEVFNANAVVLATGHSARDVYRFLQNSAIELQSKGYAMGVRVEHPQEFINKIQYHSSSDIKYLPAASYSFATQIAQRGVYSFCMCPGGFIVPASTSPGEMVVNGMSPSRRNSPFANSGMVVEIHPEDDLFGKNAGNLSGLNNQEQFEKLSFEHGAALHFAPAQRISDFVNRKSSAVLPAGSYHPGLQVSDLHQWLPDFIKLRLRDAFLMFDKKMKGFISDQALMVGVESRTSSPVRIPRDSETLQHIGLKGLFPCGEGAGYAGGIVSSAMDGQNVAKAVKAFLD